MLGGLFSNASVENVLLFLFVNQEAYPSQIRHALGLSLTPVQKALVHLENYKVVTSQFRKNKKIYSLNSNYPLHKELEELLKKAYSLLGASDKKRFCFVNIPQDFSSSSPTRADKARAELIAFWKRLSLVQTLDFTTRVMKDNDFETKRGRAEVRKSFPQENQILFHEEGKWLEDTGLGASFSNEFLWTLDLENLLISLHHLRYGPKNPVFLFNLKLSKSKSLVSIDPHLCKDDSYLGALSWKKKWIDLNLRVIGPKKNYFLNYLYY